MRTRQLLPLLAAPAIVLYALPSSAQERDAIGTTPAAPREIPTAQVAGDPVPPTEASPDHTGARRVAVASDPPGDWAVLHAGLRPHLGTFVGIGTFALAHART